MAIRWITPLAIITMMLTVSCAQQAVGDSGGVPRAHPAVPFDTFLAGLTSAAYHDYAGRAGTRVHDQQAFDEMRSYLLDRYHDATVVRSYLVADAVFDCIVPGRSPAAPPGPAKTPWEPATAPREPATSSEPQAQQGTCPDGSVPVRRATLDDLVRFRTLRQYLAKSPGGSGALPPVPG